MLNRRSFFNLFTTGSLVAPLVQGQPVLDATAKLIEPAHVMPTEPLVRPATPADLAQLLGSAWIEVTVHTPAGEHLTLAAEAVNLTMEVERDTLRSVYGGTPVDLALRSQIGFQLKGHFRDPISLARGTRF